jgi:hypothetical protein
MARRGLAEFARVIGAGEFRLGRPAGGQAHHGFRTSFHYGPCPWIPAPERTSMPAHPCPPWLKPFAWEPNVDGTLPKVANGCPIAPGRRDPPRACVEMAKLVDRDVPARWGSLVDRDLPARSGLWWIATSRRDWVFRAPPPLLPLLRFSEMHPTWPRQNGAKLRRIRA